MTIEEARVILGDEFSDLSDESIQDLIALVCAVITYVMAGDLDLKKPAKE